MEDEISSESLQNITLIHSLPFLVCFIRSGYNCAFSGVMISSPDYGLGILPIALNFKCTSYNLMPNGVTPLGNLHNHLPNNTLFLVARLLKPNLLSFLNIYTPCLNLQNDLSFST